jgi:hypothetical protein
MPSASRALLTTLSASLLACVSSDGKQTSVPLSQRDNAAQRSPDTSHPLSEFRIPHIEAHLIFRDGQLSEDIIGPHPWVLWNTIIGEGDATDRATGVHHPSEATLVRVVVTGPPNRALPDAKVKLLVIGLGPSDTVVDVPQTSLDSGGMPVLRRARVNLPGMGAGPSHIVMEAGLAPLDSTGTQFVPFRLDGTGCERIQVTARLITGRVLDSLHAEIPFECGE